VLCRVRASIDVIREALTQAGLPITIVGLGGLLDEPVVAETLAVLGAAHDPRRPAALLRLLTSPRWAVSPRDLDALADLAKRTGALAGGLAEAVTTTAGHRPVGGPPSAVLSPSARAAVHEVVGLLTAVRTAAARLPLPDLVREAARLSGADVEAAVWASDPRHPARVLDRFVSVAADFAATIGPVTRSTTGGDQVGGFIGWLEAARVHEWGLETVDVDPDPAAVQILTVHAAKGLEWDDVAVVDLAEDAFPARPRACHWLGGEAVLPWPVRGDREALPEWPGYPAGDLTDYAASWRRFLDAAQDRALAEERRLAYVAVTRARENLLLTGSAWRSGRSTARTPSPFLQDARGVAGVIVREWADRGERPIGDDLPETDWPVVLAASGRARLEEASGRVRAALSDDPPPDVPSGPGSAWDALVASLLAARVRPPRRLQARHLSVSALVRAAEDVQDAVLDVVRPVPVAPDARTDRGSRFHHWVERRLCGGALLDLDDVPGAADGDVDDDELIRSFQARFDASPWSRARVIGVEVPFDLPLAVGDQLIRIRGRVDAVMAREGGRYDVVDWKTGHEPTGARARAAALQLAVYRMAVARRLAVPVGDVGAAFWYARTGRTVWADMDLGTDAITELLVKVYAVEVTGSPSACRPSS
jgi:DNA helicase-2/ATP-dependent DNA helicase PcrA